MENFKELIKGDKPVLVDFYAQWCAPCKMMTPILENLKQAMGDKVGIIKVDIDSPQNHESTVLYQIRSVPTLILFKNGKIIWRHSGVISTEDIREVVQKNI